MSITDETRQLEVLFKIAQLLATLNVDEVLLQTLKLTTDAVGATKGSFFLLNEQKTALKRFIAARDLGPQERAIVSTRVLEEGLAGWVIANQVAAIVDDTLHDARWVMLDDAARVRSAMCVPFFVHDELRGVMTLEHSLPDHFTLVDLRLIEAAMSQASSAISNAELFDRVNAQQRELEGVLNSITEVLLVVNQDWQVHLLNPAAEALIAAKREAIQGKRLDAIVDNPFFGELIETIERGEETFELRDKASQQDFTVTVRKLTQPDSSQASYVIALYDVTSLKDLNRLKTHMIRMASHDLRNPLGVLIGYLDLMRTDIDAGTGVDRTYIDNMQKVITRMETLVATLLDTQRADQETAMKRVPIDPYALIDAVQQDTLSGAEQHNHHVINDVQSTLRPLRGDFVQLREAMDNLVNNAIKYTPDGGKIKISVYSEEERLYFVVEDSGYGIPADQQQFIFQPYFRATQEQTQHIAGTGVGLSLVKEVIERHGGNVWFESEEGAGSTFGFWLPVLA